MSKARTLADFISDGSEFADGTISVAEVSGAAPLASPTFTGTASGTFSGPLTGNVTGNVTGDLTGDVTGNVTGNLTGNVTGDVAGDIDLSAIAATIGATAVDIFVYDTRKDSDGGAWRKRTQHTSWYNETLNTATRGSRKEFPAVAVIVAESSQITIYDGDDPDLPMWMVFETGSGWNTKIIITTGAIKAVQMLNGLMAFANGNNSQGLTTIDFIEEESRSYTNVQNYGGIDTLPVSKRNSSGHTFAVNTYNHPLPLIVNNNINDVAMTVLPNAPIDPSSGLPTPTIAVATDGGVSVIKDDGTVVDITHTASTNNGATDISFDGNQISYATQQSGSSTNYWRKAFIDIPSADVTGSYTHNISGMTVYDARGTNSNSGVVLNTNSNLGDATNDIKAAVHDAVGFTNKLTLLDVDYYSDAGTPSESGSMVAYASSDYNTGWMNGDIKLATLSDTDDTNVTGSELVTNGGFATASDWTAAGDTGLSISSGQATITQSSTNGTIYQNLPTLAAGTYTFSINWVGGTHTNLYVALQDATSGGSRYTLLSVGGGANGIKTGTITVPSEEANLRIAIYGYFWGGTANGSTLIVDDVSLRLAEEDRSVNNKGLQVFGTVTKSAVATGADLMRYDGWSGSNYLQQPYNSDLDFGTGDFCYMFWFANGTDFGDNNLIHRAGGSQTVGGVLFQSISGFTLNVWNKADGVGFSGAYQQVSYPSGVWNHLVYTRRGSVAYVYLNGELKSSMSDGTNMDLPNAKLRIGIRHDSTTNYFRGDLALLRISATAPSPEQIKKIYEDEKVLFQEGAQATLYGTSDAVTALAYDDSTNLLHVGTSAGRSVFQGLRRVDNTTTAVGAAISASNGLVADE